jgi:hypothetical protein
MSCKSITPRTHWSITGTPYVDTNVDFKFRRWFIADVDSALSSPHHVTVSNVTDVSEVHDAPI